MTADGQAKVLFAFRIVYPKPSGSPSIQDGQTITVQNVTIADNQTANIPLKLASNGQGAVLVVSGVTRFTTQEATYSLRFER